MRLLQFFKNWWGWAHEVHAELLADIEHLACTDAKAVEWDALRYVSWWTNFIRLMKKGKMVVNRKRWVLVLLFELSDLP